MLPIILLFGVVAGLIVIVPMGLMLTLIPFDPEAMTTSHITGYLIMLVALSLVFVGVKRHRDINLGGVIKFVPALLIGLGISVVAGIVYVIGWEITLAATNYSFADEYARATIAQMEAKGAPPAEIAAAAKEMAAFKEMYSNPLMRLPITFIEIFPVGLLVSLVSAALLRNSRFLPARAAAQ